MSSKNKKAAAKSEPKKVAGKHDFVFGKNNYMWMMIGFAVIVLGFILMYGDKTDIYSTRRITVAPIIVLLGFGIEIYAALAKPVSSSTNESN